MKKTLLFLLVQLFATILSAQNIAVESFTPLETDLTANLEGTTVLDQNGEKCALIKVETTQRNFSFDVGSLGVMKVVEQPGEIWLYVPEKIKRITISHPQLGILRDYEFGIQILKARTYLLKLTCGSVTTIVEEQITKQHLQFSITPADAFLEVNGMAWTLSDGQADKLMDYGRYEYRVSAKNYHDEVGIIDLNNKKEIIKVDLRPAYGWVEVIGTGDIVGAKVYIDNILVGNVPMKTDKLSSGQHTLRIVQQMYVDYVSKIVVSDNQTLTVTPTLKQNFANVTFKSLDGTEIWIDRERRGTTSWTGRIEYGDHEIETKKASHRSQKKVYSISELTNGDTINLLSPVPIYGSLNIETKPLGSTIYIDGKQLDDKTSCFIDKILIGEHIVEVVKETKAPLKQKVDVKEGEICVVGGELQQGIFKVKFNSELSGLDLKIGDVVYKMPSATLDTILPLGHHTIYVSKEGYVTKTMNIDVYEDYQTFTIPQLSPKTVSLNIKTEPTDALVYIDDMYKGFAPLQLSLPGGKVYNLSIRKLDYKTYSESITLDKPKSINISLEKEPIKKVRNTKPIKIKTTESTQSVVSDKKEKTPRMTYSELLGEYYENGGKLSLNIWRIGINGGYCGGFSSLPNFWSVDASLFGLRYKMLELDWLNISCNFDPSEDMYVTYDPTLRFLLPIGRKWAMGIGFAPTFMLYYDSLDDVNFQELIDCIDFSDVSFKAELDFRYFSGVLNNFDFFLRYNHANTGVALGFAWAFCYH